MYPHPVAEHLTVRNPFTELSQETALGLTFSVTNYSIVPGNRITIQLDTYNLRYDMFMRTSNYTVECAEIAPLLTSDPSLVCEVTQQPTPAEPQLALVITLYPKLTVPQAQPV